MKLRIVSNIWSLGIAIIDVTTGEVFESGYTDMNEAKRALRNFKKMYY